MNKRSINKGNLEICLVGIFLTLLLLLFSLSACSGPTFPTGSFSMDNDHIIEFKDDGKYSYYYLGEIYTSGTFSVEGNEFNWETDSVCDAIDSGKATYIWTYENETLTFELKGEDGCEQRIRALEKVYVKVP
jgi:hypothetical protein